MLSVGRRFSNCAGPGSHSSTPPGVQRLPRHQGVEARTLLLLPEARNGGAHRGRRASGQGPATTGHGPERHRRGRHLLVRYWQLY